MRNNELKIVKSKSYSEPALSQQQQHKQEQPALDANEWLSGIRLISGRAFAQRKRVKISIFDCVGDRNMLMVKNE